MLDLNQFQQQLAQALEATAIDIYDNTLAHSGHPGSQGNAHLRITITSPKFKDVPIIDQHRMVQQAIKTLPGNPGSLIHALELKTLTPESAVL
ncbi:MAG: BolA family protein [Vampirovibrionales bacterium]|nr:BolA family protein [Vampirovibrionales bacterium]